MGFVSYAQNNEDVLLHRVFGGRQTGFYVDIGAYHPVIGSVTKSLYDLGWSGINVEPGSVFDELDPARPRDINLRMAVLDRKGEVTFHEDPNDRGMSSVLETGAGIGDVTVPCDTLEGILAAHGRHRPVDFIKIDAEGAELAIIRSTNWRVVRPHVLVIEATLPWSSILSNHDWEPLLLEQGYARAYFDGINCFYVPQEEMPTLLRNFETPVNVLDCVIPFSTVQLISAEEGLRARVWALEQTATELESLKLQHAGLESALEQSSTELKSVEQRNVCLQSELDAANASGKRIALEVAELTLARDSLMQEAGEMLADKNSVAAAHEALISDRNRLAHSEQQLAVERVRLLSEIAVLNDRVAALITPPAAATARKVATARPRLSKRIAKLLYKLIRPVARPIAWRLRGFMTGDLNTRISELQARISSLPVDSSRGVIQMPAVTVVNDVVGLAEMRKLAAEIEKALMTLAMEASSRPEVATE